MWKIHFYNYGYTFLILLFMPFLKYYDPKLQGDKWNNEITPIGQKHLSPKNNSTELQGDNEWFMIDFQNFHWTCVCFISIWFWFFHDFNTNLFERNQVSCCPSLGQDPKRGFAGSGQRPPRVEQIINGVKVGFTSWVLLKGPSVPTSKWSMFIFFPPFEKTYAFEKGGFCEIRNPVTGLSVVPWLVLDTFRYHWSGVAPARSTGLWLVCFFGVALMEESCWMYIENVEVSLWPAETNICYTKVVATRSFVEAWIWWRVFLTVWTLI